MLNNEQILKEIINKSKVVSQNPESQRKYKKDLDAHGLSISGKTDLIPIDKFSLVVVSCELMKTLRERALNEVLGNAEGLALISLLAYFQGWEQIVKNEVKGWGKTNDHWDEINTYTKSYSIPKSCKKLIESGVCTKKKPCSSSGGVIGGEHVGPNPLLYALKSSKYSSRNEVHITSKFTIEDKVQNIANAIKSIDSYFIQGRDLVLINQDGYQRAIDQEDLRSLITPFIDFFTNQMNADGSIEKLFIDMPFNLINLIKRRIEKIKLREIKIYSSTPVLLPDSEGKFLIASDGYHESKKLYVGSNNISIGISTNKIDYVLSDFRFKSEIDRVNVKGFMLIPLIHYLLPGDVPAMLIEGNQPGLGKTELAILLGSIMQGSHPLMMKFSSDEGEMEKALCGGMKIGKRNAIFDNVKASKDVKFLGGPWIEMIITSKEFNFRILGGNNIFIQQNNLVPMFTTNGIGITEDFVTRKVGIELYGEGELDNDFFKEDNISEFALDNYNEIFGEILFMADNWIKKGCPLSSAKHRFKKWASITGGILEANGITGFLSNQSQLNEETFNPVAKAFIDGFKYLHPHRKYTAKEILDLLRDKSPLFVDYTSPIVFAKKVLSPLQGKVLTNRDGEQRILKKAGENSSKVAVYELKDIYKAGETGGIKDSSPEGELPF